MEIYNIGDIVSFRRIRMRFIEQPLIVVDQKPEVEQYEETINGIIVAYDNSVRMAIVWFFDDVEQKIVGKAFPYEEIFFANINKDRPFYNQ